MSRHRSGERQKKLCGNFHHSQMDKDLIFLDLTNQLNRVISDEGLWSDR